MIGSAFGVAARGGDFRGRKLDARIVRGIRQRAQLTKRRVGGSDVRHAEQRLDQTQAVIRIGRPQLDEITRHVCRFLPRVLRRLLLQVDLQALLVRQTLRVRRRLLGRGRRFGAVTERRPRLREIAVCGRVPGRLRDCVEQLVARTRGIVAMQRIEREANAPRDVRGRRLRVRNQLQLIAAARFDSRDARANPRPPAQPASAIPTPPHRAPA